MFTPLKMKASNQFGEWISSDPKLIKMENDTRIGRVLSFREAHVTLTHNLHPASPLHLKLVPLQSISMISNVKPLTNAPGVITEVALLLRGKGMESRKSNLVRFRVLQRAITANVCF